MKVQGAPQVLVQPADVKRACTAPGVRVVGFDMDGVLFGTDTWESFKQIGWRPMAKFMWSTRSFPGREAFFESLRHPSLARETGNMSVVHQGGELPSILTAWQCGLISGKDAEHAICTYYDSEECTLSTSAKAMFKGVAHLMLDPASFVASRKVLLKGFAVLKTLSSNDSPLLLVGLSNWDSQSFALLRKKFPEVFKYLKFVVISGETKATKPSAASFECLLKEVRAVEGYADVEPKDMVFLDDEKVNVERAESMGFHAYQYLDEQ
jgi:FMN phosphatase YigB (HAD superfamily)